MDYSAQEKQDLAKKFRNEMARKKAEELGVDENDLIMRVDNGKMNWIQKTKAYSELEKQRQLATPNKVIRSLRGEDSLLTRINKEVDTCLRILSSTAIVAALSGLELSDYRSTVNKTKNRTDNTSLQLGEVEERIERTKKEDPVFSKGEAALLSMKKAKDQKDQKKLEQLAVMHKDLLVQYNQRRTSLEPQVESARGLRLDLQREYWRVMHQHWKLDNKFIVHVRKALKTVLDGMASETEQQNLALQIKPLVDRLNALTQKQTELAERCPPKNVEVQLATSALDYILPEMQTIVDELSQLKGEFEQLKKTCDSSQGKKDTHRMAYAEQKEHDTGSGSS